MHLTIRNPLQSEPLLVEVLGEGRLWYKHNDQSIHHTVSLDDDIDYNSDKSTVLVTSPVTQEMKWEKMFVRLMCWQGLHTMLRISPSKDKPDDVLNSITISKDVLIVPMPQEDKKISYNIIDGRKTLHIASESSTKIVAWVDMISCIVELKGDPLRCEDPHCMDSIRPKLEELNKQLTKKQHHITTDIKKIQEEIKQIQEEIKPKDATSRCEKYVDYARTELRKLRPLTWLDDVEKMKQILREKFPKNDVDNRDKVVYEFVLTEQVYVKSLLILLHVFKNPLKKLSKELSISDELFSVIFSNLEEIISNHTQFLTDLTNAVTNWSPTTSLLSETLSKGVPHLQSYRTYAAGFDVACDNLNELLKKVPVSTFVNTLQEDTLCKGLPLAAFLIMPIQRVPRYLLLLKELLNYTNSSHIDYESLVTITKEFESAAESINLAPKYHNDIVQTIDTVKRIEKHKENMIMRQGRIFLFEGELEKINKGGEFKSGDYILFTDLLLCCTQNCGKRVIRRKYIWNTLSVTDDTSKPNAFKIISEKSSCSLVAPSLELKNKWVEAFLKVRNRPFEIQPVPVWLAASRLCLLCLKEFSRNRKRNYCKRCGWVVCHFCSKGSKRIRHCDNCIESMKKGNEEIDLLQEEEHSEDDMSDYECGENLEENDEIEEIGVTFITTSDSSGAGGVGSGSGSGGGGKLRLLEDSTLLKDIPNTKKNSIKSELIKEKKPLKIEERFENKENFPSRPSFSQSHEAPPFLHILQSIVSKASLTTIPNITEDEDHDTSIELLINRRLNLLIYNNEYKFGKFNGMATPSAAIDIWTWITSYDILISNSSNFTMLLNAIQLVATNLKMVTLNASIYWLSTVCALTCLVATDNKQTIKRLEPELNHLFFQIFKSIQDHLYETILPHLENIFTSKDKLHRHPSFIWKPTGSPMDITDLLRNMSTLLTSCVNNNLPKTCIRSIFRHFLARLNQGTFNVLVNKPDLCTAENGFNIKLNINLIQEWLSQKDVLFHVLNTGKRFEQLSQASTLLTIDKNILQNDENLLREVCPSLDLPFVRFLIKNSKTDTSLNQNTQQQQQHQHQHQQQHQQQQQQQQQQRQHDRLNGVIEESVEWIKSRVGVTSSSDLPKILPIGVNNKKSVSRSYWFFENNKQ
eukprot:TRINITY_DN1146_c2_g3_i1.p1 TRINITY_DN1146_c2_g3~~TRINITY_DN1146_c2_g3_i1.p1  ORF type:complete len:1145 (+),score=213.32 TRINITY_DN1146_c2_g3_i1:199-3633(+)